MQNLSKNSAGYLLALSAAIIFSSKAIVVKLAYQYQADSLSILALRMTFALPIYIIIEWVRDKSNDTLTSWNLKDVLWMLVMGLLGYYLSSYLDFVGLQYISANLERLILFVYPTLTTILSAIILKKKISLTSWLAIVICYFGVFVSFFKQDNSSPDLVIGAFFVFLSALTYSFFLIGSEKLIPRYGAQKFTSYIMIISCLWVFVHLSIQTPPNLFQYPSEVYLLGFFLAIFCTVLPTYMIGMAIKILGASTTSILSMAGPVSVIFLSYFILNESITVFHLIGTIIVILGILLITQKK
jgi:drug/metabolite transporter (DMT)-like permease